MKRFLAVVLAIFAVLVAIPNVTAEAADVPDFRQVAGRQVKNTSRVRWSRDDLGRERHYLYGWSVDLDENFCEQYVNLIQRTGLFKLIANNEGGYTNTKLTDWYFVYVGPKKNVPTFRTREQDYYDVHLSITKSANYRTGDTELTIHVAPRLTYGGDDWADR